MESRPHVEACPPALIELAVRLLVPPAAREHVLGDLAERYSSPGQYLVEAARTLPFVVASQIRRTSPFAMWPMVALMLTSGFGAGANGSWLRGAIPALATMIGFMFRDAYRVPDLQHTWRQGLVDATVAAAGAVLSQAVVAAARPEWLAAPAGVAGGGIVLAMLYVLRVQNPPGRSSRPVPTADGAVMTFEQLRSEVALFDRSMRRGASIEIVTGYVMVPVFAALALFASPLFVRIGAGLTVAGIFFVVWYIRRRLKAAVPVHRDADFAATLAGYRARLEHHHDAMRTLWLWYLLPIGIGPAAIFGAAAMAASRPAADAIGPVITFVVIWVSVAWSAGLKARALRRRMTAIERVEEQQ